jgi:hypothetical protein
MFDMMMNIGPINYKLDAINKTSYFQAARCDVTEARLRLLEYKSIDNETRMLRNNLIFSGHAEIVSADNCHGIICEFLKQNLNLDPKSFCITKANRIGKRQVVRAQGSVRHRAILVTFRDENDTDIIMNNAKLLKNTHFGISRDYPREISEARRELWPQFKQARSKYGPRNVKIKFPAALEINGDVVRDLFPGWYETLRGSRNSNVQARIQERYNHTVEITMKNISKELPVEEEINVDEVLSEEENNDIPPPKHSTEPVISHTSPKSTTSGVTSKAPGYLMAVHAPLQNLLTESHTKVTHSGKNPPPSSSVCSMPTSVDCPADQNIHVSTR